MSEDQRETPKRLKTCSDKASTYVLKSFEDKAKTLLDIEDPKKRNQELHEYIEDLINKSIVLNHILRNHADIKLEHEYDHGFENPIEAWFNFLYDDLNSVSNRRNRDLLTLKRKVYLPEKVMPFEEKLEQLKVILDVEYNFTQNRFSM